MTLIGLGGAARAGKDTLAEILRDEYGYVVMGMSDPLRDALVALDPWIKLEEPIALSDGSSSFPGVIRFTVLLRLVGYEQAKTVPEVRRLLQQLGTEVGRKMIDEDVWVITASRRIIAEMKRQAQAQPIGFTPRIIVTGIRFENELDMVHLLAGRSVYVHRSSAIQAAPAHASELSLLPRDFDRLLDNNGSLEHLAEMAHELMNDLGVSRNPRMSAASHSITPT